MTHPTDEELDEMARDLCHTGELSMPYRCKISDAICALRAQLAEANARAEAALAAQIEADLAKYGPHTNEGLLPNLGLQPGDRVVRVTGHDKWSDPDIGSEYTFCINSNYRKGVPHLIKDGSGWTTMTEKGTFRVIGRKPHDRTALEQMLAEAREKALREAADMFDADSNIAQTIRALIEATNAQP